MLQSFVELELELVDAVFFVSLHLHGRVVFVRIAPSGMEEGGQKLLKQVKRRVLD